MDGSVREGRLIEHNVARDDDTVGRDVKAFVALMICRLSEENTKSGSWAELVRHGGGHVGIAGAPENPKMRVDGMNTIESEVGCVRG